jgi:hypothetical protein
MEPKLLLVHSLLLLFWENKLDTKTEGSRELVKEVLDSIEPPATTLDTDTDRHIIVGLKSTIQSMLKEDANIPIDKTMLLQRVCLNTKGDDSMYQMIVRSMDGDYDQPQLRRQCIDYSKSLIEARKSKQFMDMVRKWTRDILYGDINSLGSTSEIALAMQADLDAYAHGNIHHGIGGIAGMVDYVDFDDIDSIRELFLKAKEESSTDGILRTGYQALNRMLGDYGGFRRGDFVLVGAFQHNYKTGFTLNLTRHIAIYNKPYMINADKKPLIIHISSENQLTDNLMLMAEGFYENKYLKAYDRTVADPEIAAKWIKTESMVNGYTLKMHRVNPSEFTYSSLFQLIMEYESQGYEIHLLTIDYLNMFNKAGCVSNFTGADTRDLFRRVRNFCNARKITVITPHQISMDAKGLQRMGADLIVKELVGKSYWDSCKTIDQEVDIELLINIEIVDGRKYLTVQRGKHRKSGAITPLKDLFCIFPFHAIGAIRDDINGVDLSVKKLGQRSMVGGSGSDDDDSMFSLGQDYRYMDTVVEVPGWSSSEAYPNYRSEIKPRGLIVNKGCINGTTRVA